MENRLTENLLVKVWGLVLLSGMLFSAPAQAQLSVVSESAVYNPITKVVVFRIKFNEAPDFTTRDEFGRLVTSFQYFIYGRPKLFYPENLDSIIRGEEMSKREIPIRDASPSDEPGAGGWGAIRGVAPYKLDGKVLTISTQLKSISDHSALGYFLYDLLIAESGAGIDRVDKSRSSIAPQPSAKSQCLNNGWLNFGFLSETHCVTYVGGP